MPVETISFHVPASIHQGLIKGDYRQFGGVVRDNGGRVVTMLEPVAKSATEAAKRNWRIAIAAVGVAALAGAAVYVARRSTKRARLQRRLEKVGASIAEGCREGRTLSKEQLAEVAAAIAAFLELSQREGFRDVEIVLDAKRANDLLEFGKSLRAFSDDVAARAMESRPVPEFAPENPADCSSTLTAILGQLTYQQEHWPSEAAAVSH